MTAILITIHILSALVLVLSILLQPGRSSGFSVTFSETATAIFGGKGATSFLEKVTAGAAAVFILTSVTLAIRMGRGGGGSVMQDVKTPPPVTAPEALPVPTSPSAVNPPAAAPPSATPEASPPAVEGSQAPAAPAPPAQAPVAPPPSAPR
ncbi:MAG: preprotein translocase subunit SecG [Nitrospirae bacterium]|nr:preprotein translocase subunit SecG [Nitrospirota bacterium]